MAFSLSEVLLENFTINTTAMIAIVKIETIKIGFIK
jgi:hypothetical protein